MSKRKILIVDDEIGNLKYIEFLLNSKGYKVLTAQNGKECLNILKNEDIDILLLDIVMPGMSGLEVLEQIRKDSNLKTLPVLLVSSLTEKDSRLKGLSLGADDFINKPFDKDELITKIETQIKLQYERRKLSEKEKLLEIIEKISEGIVITDKDYEILYMNKVSKVILGNIEDLREKDFQKILRDRYFVSFQKDQTELILTDNKSKKVFKCLKQEIKNIEGIIDSYIFILIDITEEFMENSLKLDFLSLITHKIFTPFTSLSGNIQLLKKKIKGDDSLRDRVLKIERDKDKLYQMLNRILYFIEIQKENLKEIVNKERLIQFIENLKIEKKVNFNIELDDEFELYKFIIAKELIENAIKFSNKGEIFVKVKIKGREIVVSDNGDGIPEAEKEKIFEPFYQIDREKTGQIPGVGLGLSIVKKVTELFNGTLVLDSKESEGSNFKILFSI